ncbi:gliding motility-associated C-terminal domain-containing protein [Taibaiella soli]|uniref:LTD domain-containing protein n=1 Tax=Taibaiella soli TaxID=1649169 RepID=A0A2W2B0A1_9BACT|nr:gliding motility-associated C-terminal domain-containing protein [Taibaiella soli]PZF73398.1 hypothetical protein DN068_08380 [Taibaiella soli]
MRKQIFITFLTLLITCVAQAQLVINEFSQGSGGAKEYVELVVVGTRHCNDTAADLRGWIIDDNNGWYGAGAGQGIATGCMRLANVANWANVPYGSIILIYNSGDKNTSITQADDPTDSDHDHVYIVPSSSQMIEKNGSSPTSPSSSTYVYPTTGFSAGGNWDYIGLRNDGDAILVAAPTNLTQAYHSISYGDVQSGTPTIHQSQAGANKVYYLNDAQYAVTASWITGNAPGNESPGVANSSANALWISSMLNPVAGGGGDTNLYHCMLAGQTYAFNGQLLTASGVYHDTIGNGTGCDSLVHLHLQVLSPQAVHDTLRGCNQVNYNGQPYTTATVLSDTIHSVLGCDSAYHFVHILLHPIAPSLVFDTVSGCQAYVYKGMVYDSSQIVVDTLVSVYGCDSVYKTIYINVLDRPVITTSGDKDICSGDSVMLAASSSSPVIWIGLSNSSDVSVFPSGNTTYIAAATNALGCTDTAYVKVTVHNFLLNLVLDAPSYLEEGVSFALKTSAFEPYVIQKWLPGNEFAGSTAPLQTIMAGESKWYSVVAANAIGCVDSQSVFVNVNPKYPDIFMPSAFSPNGDNRNDFFRPVFSGPYIIAEFSVFNRWGQMVYHVSGNGALKDGWDGTYGEKPCEVDTYFYTLTASSPSGKPVHTKGDVTLIR